MLTRHEEPSSGDDIGTGKGDGFSLGVIGTTVGSVEVLEGGCFVEGEIPAATLSVACSGAALLAAINLCSARDSSKVLMLKR